MCGQSCLFAWLHCMMNSQEIAPGQGFEFDACQKKHAKRWESLATQYRGNEIHICCASRMLHCSRVQGALRCNARTVWVAMHLT